MRGASLFPLAFTAALAAGCASEMPRPAEREETAARPQGAPDRDLTLKPPAPSAMPVVSAVELDRPEPPAPPVRTVRPRPRPKPAPAPVTESIALEPAAPAPAVTQPTPEPEPASGGRELAPGKTVTVIPVSNGPVIEAAEDDSWLPSERARGIGLGGGGTCKPRRGVRGIGIAGRIPVGIPVRRLR
jgi:hypothetical protein